MGKSNVGGMHDQHPVRKAMYTAPELSLVTFKSENGFANSKAEVTCSAIILDEYTENTGTWF